jgi:ubiquinol-cytochrome c reductase cytochrome c subunit
VPVAAALLALVVLPAARAAPAPPDARRVYLRDCAVCHAADGTGTNRGPVLSGVGRASIHYWVSTGRMPLSSPTERDRRRPPRYSAATQDALIDYVTQLTGPGPAVPAVDTHHADLARGGELYRLDCAACHAWAATGGALLEREAPPLGKSTPVQVAEAIRVGPGVMPAFGPSAITDDDLSAVAAYVRALQNPQDRGGNPLGHIGPLAEGAAAFVVGLGALLVASRIIGKRA